MLLQSEVKNTPSADADLLDPPTGSSRLSWRARPGPLPALPASGSTLSRAGRSLLEALLTERAPLSVAALVGKTRLHPNTVRENLDALVGGDLASRQRTMPSGRGRPAWLYEATAREPDSSRSEYAGLAAALASVIQRISDSPRQDGIVAGMRWGRQLARGRRHSGGRRVPGARRQLLSLLEDMGFAPRSARAGGVVRLTRCPLVEAARMHPDVVCGVHLGVVRGALREFGGASRGTALFPFAESGACRLELGSQASRARA